MYVDFEQLPSSARIWVYLSDRPWNTDEIRTIESSARVFVDQWTAHQQTLRASFRLFHRQFLVIAVDQESASASGCSIDKSVAFVQELERTLQCRMMDRLLFAFKEDEAIRAVPKDEFERLAEAGQISDSTIVFDNLVDTVQALNHRWEIPFERSWHKVLVG